MVCHQTRAWWQPWSPMLSDLPCRAIGGGWRCRTHVSKRSSRVEMTTQALNQPLTDEPVMRSEGDTRGDSFGLAPGGLSRPMERARDGEASSAGGPWRDIPSLEVGEGMVTAGRQGRVPFCAAEDRGERRWNAGGRWQPWPTREEHAGG